MRTDIVFELHDGKKGCALLRGGWQNTLIIYLPGYGGNVRLYALPDRAGRYFEARGISFLALNLYDPWNKEARNLSDQLTLEDHVSDVRTAMRVARENGVRYIHVAGHSLAAYPALMAARTQEQALSPSSVILWDGSKPTPPLSLEGLRYEPDRDYYVSEEGTGIVVSRCYFESVQSFRIEDLSSNWDRPVLAIEAGQNDYLRGVSKVYRAHLGEKWVQSQVVPGCKHHFIEDDEGCELLFDYTLKWVKGGYQRT